MESACLGPQGVSARGRAGSSIVFGEADPPSTRFLQNFSRRIAIPNVQAVDRNKMNASERELANAADILGSARAWDSLMTWVTL